MTILITNEGMEELKQRLIGKPVIYNKMVVAHVIDAIQSEINNGQFHIVIKAEIPEEQGYIEDLMKTQKAFVDI